MVRSFYHLIQPRSWRTTPCQSSATAYSIYSQLSSILEANSSMHNPRTHNAVVTGTHLSWYLGLKVHKTRSPMKSASSEHCFIFKCGKSQSASTRYNCISRNDSCPKRTVVMAMYHVLPEYL